MRRFASFLAVGVLAAMSPAYAPAQEGGGETPEDKMNAIMETLPVLSPSESGYQEANGLNMFFEVYGTGEPLVLLHGAYMSTRGMAGLIEPLMAHHTVYALEMQGHGRTADIDRPITYEAMADDVAAFMAAKGIETADVLGYSMGGGIAVQLAVRHPEAVRKMVAISASYSSDALPPGFMDMISTFDASMMAGTPMEAEYLALAPDPDGFANLVEKLKVLDMTPFHWPEDDIRGITAPTLLVVGDSDVVSLEHAVAMFKLLGGGVFGDMQPMPASQLAILPGTSHVTAIANAPLLMGMIEPFLESPMPSAD
jgi:pimeloyl-ACP methyl ester carboxylesterase